MKKIILLLFIGLLFTSVSNTQAQAPDIDIGDLQELVQKSEIIIATVNVNHDVCVEKSFDSMSYDYQESYSNQTIVLEETVAYRITPDSYNHYNRYAILKPYNGNSGNLVDFDNPVRKVANKYYYPDYY